MVALRTAALQALGGLPPFERDVRLALKVHVGPTNDRRAGDLDNYVAGVCDGLMAADPRSSVHPSLRTPERPEIHPSQCIAIRDDSEIISIQAEKLFGLGNRPWFEVVLEGD